MGRSTRIFRRIATVVVVTVGLADCDGPSEPPAASAPSAAGPPAAQTAAPGITGCAASGELRYICGPRNAEDIVRLPETAALQGASTALAVDDEIWIGTFNGDRVGYLPKQ